MEGDDLEYYPDGKLKAMVCMECGQRLKYPKWKHHSYSDCEWYKKYKEQVAS